MRVLILAPRAPFPPDHGAALRNEQILAWIGARHEVALVAFGDPLDRVARAELERHARRVTIIPPPPRPRRERLRDLILTGQPDLARRLRSPELVEVIGDHLKPPGFDVVQIEGLEMAAAWEAARQASSEKAPRVILDAHNAEYALQASAAWASLRRGALLAGLYSLVQTRRLKRYERAVCRGADAVIAVSPEDAAALRALDPKLRVTVVPNGVDLAWYQPGDRRSDGATALFIGKLDYRPNLDAIEWLVDEIWPRVVRDEPRARLLIVGRDAPSRLDRVNRVAGVKLVGAVPDERPWFDQADVLVVPMRMGGGVRLKVVQAMAMGVPVVATPAGVAGLDLADGDHYLRGETGPALADQIVRLLRDPPLRQRLATNGRDRATASYDWRVILPGLDRAYADLAGVR